MTHLVHEEDNPAMTTWADIASALESRGGRPGYRNGTMRTWHIPSPDGGTFAVEVTLRPRWCSAAVDRWRTSDRAGQPSAAWFREHVWPLVDAACRRRGCAGVLPTGGGTYAHAHPVDRAALLPMLTAWVDAELTWGTPRQRTCEEDPHVPMH